MNSLLKIIVKIPQVLAVSLIEIYQATISPDHGLLKGLYPYGFCHFYPSCSQYAKESIIKKGFIKGSAVGLLRIIKCNPWTHPRVDLASH